MGVILLGLLLGLVIGWLVCDSDYKFDGLLRIAIYAVSIIVTTVSVCYASYMLSLSYIETYSSTKQLIEESLENSTLSGLERIELVGLAMEENKKLIHMQFTRKQWYGFTLSKSILELEPISLKEELNYGTQTINQNDYYTSH